jgi:hypothetical protein
MFIPCMNTGYLLRDSPLIAIANMSLTQVFEQCSASQSNIYMYIYCAAWGSVVVKALRY